MSLISEETPCGCSTWIFLKNMQILSFLNMMEISLVTRTGTGVRGPVKKSVEKGLLVYGTIQGIYFI